MREETKCELKDLFDKGLRFSVITDEWTSIRNRRYLNVCVATNSRYINLGLARCWGSMTAKRTALLIQVIV
jgi:hypothetical protein